MTTDRSVDFQNTWAFLDRRLEDVQLIGRLPSQVRSVCFVPNQHGNLLRCSCTLRRQRSAISCLPSSPKRSKLAQRTQLLQQAAHHSPRKRVLLLQALLVLLLALLLPAQALLAAREVSLHLLAIISFASRGERCCVYSRVGESVSIAFDSADAQTVQCLDQSRESEVLKLAYPGASFSFTKPSISSSLRTHVRYSSVTCCPGSARGWRVLFCVCRNIRADSS